MRTPPLRNVKLKVIHVADNTAEKTSLEHILTAYREVEEMPFPRPVTNDKDIGELYGYLAEWDASVAGYMNRVVEKLVDGRRPLLNVQLRVPSFEKMIQRLLTDKPEYAEILLDYRRYYRKWIDFSEQVERLRKEWKRHHD